MVKDRLRLSHKTAQESSHQDARTASAPGGRSFFPALETERRGTRFLDGPTKPHAHAWRLSGYIIAAGGAGSSGLPALESGSRTSKVPSKRMTMEPAK